MDSDFSFDYLLQSPQENTMGEVEEERTTRREPAYIRKLEEVQWPPYVDYVDETMEVQIQPTSRNTSRPNPSFSLRHSGRSHLECWSSSTPSRTPPTGPNSGSGPSDPMVFERNHVDSPSKSPPQQLQPSNYFSPNNQSVHFYCEICQVPCSGSLNYHNHLNGKKHKVKFQALKLGWKDDGDDCETDNPRPWLRCEKCEIWCIDENTMKQHLAGKKHKKMQKKLETVEGGMGEELECAVCGIRCSSKELLQLHLKGKKHREELRKQESAGEEGRDRVPMKCKLCGTWCMDRSSLQVHLREKKHFMNGLEAKKRQWRELIRENEANN